MYIHNIYIYIYVYMIHFAVYLNLTQHCKLTIPQEKKFLIKKRQIWDFFQ